MTLAFIATFRIGKIPLHHPPAVKAKSLFVLVVLPREDIFVQLELILAACHFVKTNTTVKLKESPGRFAYVCKSVIVHACMWVLYRMNLLACVWHPRTGCSMDFQDR